MKEYPQTIQGLYYNYKKLSDEEIRKHLSHIILVTKQHAGEGTVYGYRKYDQTVMDKILEKPRETSHTFDTGTPSEIIKGLTEWKTIRVLVKSSSRFFLKPDIGEVLDQILWLDIDNVKAIYTMTDAEELAETEGEHFIIHAVLFK